MEGGRFNKVWKKVCIECQKRDLPYMWWYCGGTLMLSNGNTMVFEYIP